MIERCGSLEVGNGSVCNRTGVAVSRGKHGAKVFSLVGKSADEVRSLVSHVSQEVTSTEERVRLNRIQHEITAVT